MVTVHIKGFTNLTTILLLWKVSDLRILETLTSTDKLFRPSFSIQKDFKIFVSWPYLANPVTRIEKGLYLK